VACAESLEMNILYLLSMELSRLHFRKSNTHRNWRKFSWRIWMQWYNYVL